MARSPIPFRTCFDQACRRIGYTAAQVDADAALKAQLLDLFNDSYSVGYKRKVSGWQDARTGATIEPTGRVIEFSVLGDAHEYDVWEYDPRDVDGSTRLAVDVDSAGIRLLDDFEDVWVRWIPAVVKFTTTPWATGGAYAVGDLVLIEDAGTTLGNCYKCLVAHTSGTFATDLAASDWVLVPVLAVLESFAVWHFKGSWEFDNGQPETGAARMDRALADLEDIVLQEIRAETRGGSATATGVLAGSASATLKYVRFDTDQNLTLLQQLQGLENLGITIAADGLMTLPGGYTIYLNAP